MNTERVEILYGTGKQQRTFEGCPCKRLCGMIARLCSVLGIITERRIEVLDEEVEAMIAARQQARKEKNFALADEIRGKLLDMGIVLEDTREGVKWKRA